MGLIPQQVKATQLLYRTTDMNGLPQATVTTVLIPAGHSPADSRCMVSYQCAIDALSSKCFPSYAMRHRAKALGSLAQLELLMVAAALAEGWVVSVPDHEGTEGMWGTPCEPGYRVLDGLRAALGYDAFGLAPETKIGLWGYSGGGLASSWAAEMHSDYAPELNIVGAVLGSPVGDLGNTFRRLNGTNLSALPAMVVAALAKSYPGLKRVINEYATTEGLEVLRRLDDMTTGEAVIRMFRADMDDLVVVPLEDVLSTPEVQHVFKDIKLGRHAPSIPVLIVQAVHDGVIAVDDIDGVADAYSAGGTQVTYHRDQFSGHILLHPMSAPMTLRWLTDRFADRPVREHIIRTAWPTLFNPITYLGMARLAGIVGRVISGGRVPFRPL
jgi:triacylglycerol lipase